MSRPRKAKHDESDEFERFERAAREHGVELDEKKLAETLRRMAKREKSTDAPERPTKDRSSQSGG